MITRIYTSSSFGTFAVTWFLLSLLISGVFVTTSVKAQEEVADSLKLSLQDEYFAGTVNSVHPDSFMLIIDDHSFVLNSVVRFNSASWSRDQVIQRIEQGDRVKLEVGPIADDQSGARTVTSIFVTDQ